MGNPFARFLSLFNRNTCHGANPAKTAVDLLRQEPESMRTNLRPRHVAGFSAFSFASASSTCTHEESLFIYKFHTITTLVEPVLFVSRTLRPALGHQDLPRSNEKEQLEPVTLIYIYICI